jgi:hypothetical protein
MKQWVVGPTVRGMRQGQGVPTDRRRSKKDLGEGCSDLGDEGLLLCVALVKTRVEQAAGAWMEKLFQWSRGIRAWGQLFLVS